VSLQHTVHYLVFAHQYIFCENARNKIALVESSDGCVH
jgi:hypothetical protein